MVLALLIMAIVLYILVRRSVERRYEQHTPPVFVEKRHSPSQSRTSVTASDSPEVDGSIIQR